MRKPSERSRCGHSTVPEQSPAEQRQRRRTEREGEAYQLEHLSEVKRIPIADFNLTDDKYQESIGVGAQLDIDRQGLARVFHFAKTLVSIVKRERKTER
jgi:hypothetical protein